MVLTRPRQQLVQSSRQNVVAQPLSFSSAAPPSASSPQGHLAFELKAASDSARKALGGVRTAVVSFCQQLQIVGPRVQLYVEENFPGKEQNWSGSVQLVNAEIQPRGRRASRRRRMQQGEQADGRQHGILLVDNRTAVVKPCCQPKAAAAEPLSSVQVAAPPAPAPKTLLRNIWEGAVAGAAAGVTVETALYPIDTIKTRLQAAAKGAPIVLKGLYSGLSGNIVGVLPASAIFVGVYEPLKLKLLDRLPPNLSIAAHLSAAAAGATASSLVRVPTEVIKQRMQTGQFTSAAGAVQGILAKEGVRGLYAGYNSFLLRDLPFDAIQFAIYEQLKIAGKKFAKRDLKDTEMAVIGAISGAITGAVTTPLDVIKTRLMVQGASGRYKGIADCVAKISAEEGTSALFRGIAPRVMWIGIGGSIFFSVLEKTKTLMANRHTAHVAAQDALLELKSA